MASVKKSDDLKSESSVCIICYKSYINPVNSNDNKGISTSIKFLFRQLRINTGIGLDSVKTCVECSSLLESYAEIYHKWKLLELQLQWRISEISNVIRTAGRIPKRVQAFKAWCTYQDYNCQDGLRLGSDLRELRSSLKFECMSQRNSFPRLRLNRVDHKTTTDTGSQEQKALILGWLTSCIAIAALTDFNNITRSNVEQMEEIPLDETREMKPSLKDAEIIKNPVDTGPLSQRPDSQIKTVIPTATGNPGPQMEVGNARTPALHQPPILVSTNNTPVPNNLSDKPATGKTPTADSSSTGHRSKRKCGADHEKRTYGFTECKAPIKLKASVDFDFVCPVCNKTFKNPQARYMLECHIAIIHRFHHESARGMYQYVNETAETTGIYFCALCGSKEASFTALTNHLRRNHKKDLKKAGLPFWNLQ